MINDKKEKVSFIKCFKVFLFSIIIATGICLLGCKDTQNNIECKDHDYELSSLLVESFNAGKLGQFKCKHCNNEKTATINSADVDMPILEINGDMSTVTKEVKGIVEISYEDEDFSFTSEATIKWQGASSLGYPKKNYNIQFLKTGTTKKKKIELNEAWGEQSKYTLKANYVDFSHARNVVSGRIYSEVVKSGEYDDEVINTPNGGVVDGYPVLIYQNGEYHGIYTLNIPKDNWMFGMEDDDEDTPEVEYKHAAISMGSWEKPCLLEETIDDFSDDVELEFSSTEDTQGNAWVLDSFNDMVEFVNLTTDEEFKANIDTYVNLDRVIDSMIYTSVIVAADNNAKNIMWLTYDGQRWFSSVYDMDGTWGLKYDGKTYYSYDFTVVSDTMGNKLWKRVYKLYKNEIVERYQELRQDVLSIDNIEDHFEDFEEDIAVQARIADSIKWQGISNKQTNNIKQIIQYAKQRLAYLDTHL